MAALCKGFRVPRGPAPLRQEEPPITLAIIWCKMRPSPGVPWHGVPLVTTPNLPSFRRSGLSVGQWDRDVLHKSPCQCLHPQVLLQDTVPWV